MCIWTRFCASGMTQISTYVYVCTGKMNNKYILDVNVSTEAVIERGRRSDSMQISGQHFAAREGGPRVMVGLWDSTPKNQRTVSDSFVVPSLHSPCHTVRQTCSMSCSYAENFEMYKLKHPRKAPGRGLETKVLLGRAQSEIHKLKGNRSIPTACPW